MSIWILVGSIFESLPPRSLAWCVQSYLELLGYYGIILQCKVPPSGCDESRKRGKQVNTYRQTSVGYHIETFGISKYRNIDSFNRSYRTFRYKKISKYRRSIYRVELSDMLTYRNIESFDISYRRRFSLYPLAFRCFLCWYDTERLFSTYRIWNSYRFDLSSINIVSTSIIISKSIIVSNSIIRSNSIIVRYPSPSNTHTAAASAVAARNQTSLKRGGRCRTRREPGTLAVLTLTSLDQARGRLWHNRKWTRGSDWISCWALLFPLNATNHHLGERSHRPPSTPSRS